VIVTVTATPAPPSSSQALSALEVWLACSFALQGTYWGSDPTMVVNDYANEEQSDASWVAHLDFSLAPGAMGAQATCTAGGTVGSPIVIIWRAFDTVDGRPWTPSGALATRSTSASVRWMSLADVVRM
jgi:hypothetical protein